MTRVELLLGELEAQFGAAWFIPAEVQSDWWPRGGSGVLEGPVAKGLLLRRALKLHDPRRAQRAQFEYRLPA